MEPSAHNNQPLEIKQEPSHVLHPPQEVEQFGEVSPNKITNMSTRDTLSTFDYGAVTAMTQPSSPSTETPEQLAGPNKEPKLHLRESVLRPDSLKKKMISDRVRALATVAVVGLSGATVMNNAAAGGINTKPYEQQKTMEVLNGVVGIFANDAVIKRDQQGNPVLVQKSPQERAVNLRPTFYPNENQMRQYATSLGMNITNEGLLFVVRSTVDNSVIKHFSKFNSPTNYTNAIYVKPSQNGISVTVNYVLDNMPKTQVMTITNNGNGTYKIEIIGG